MGLRDEPVAEPPAVERAEFAGVYLLEIVVRAPSKVHVRRDGLICRAVR